MLISSELQIGATQMAGGRSSRLLLLLLLLGIAFLCGAAGSGDAAAAVQTLEVAGIWGSWPDGSSRRAVEEAADLDAAEGVSLSLTHRDAQGSPFRAAGFSSKSAVWDRLERDRMRVEGINSRVRSLVHGAKLTPAVSFQDYLKYEEEAAAAAAKNSQQQKKKTKKKSATKKKKKALGPSGKSIVPGGQAAGGFEGEVVSGLFAGSGEYFVTLGVGTPQVKTSMVVDTGSDVLWLQCAPCRSCYNQIGNIFQPKQSSSYRRLPCASNACQLLDARSCSTSGAGCLYQVTYGDGSYTVGDFSTESLTLTARGGSEYTVKSVAFGCGHDNEGLFIGAAGLLGLGRGSLSFPSQVGHIAGQVFSYCLVDRESSASSSLSFGKSSIPNGTLFTPLLSNPRVKTFYYVGLTGISVGGSKVAVSPSLFTIDASGTGGVIIDSGTSVTRLPSAAYAATRDQFVRLAAKDLGQPTRSFSIFDACYDLSQRQRVQVPILSLLFQGGVEVHLPARNYMVQVDPQGTVCFAFAPTSGSLSIIGNVQQMGIRVVHDVQGRRLGFAPSQC